MAKFKKFSEFKKRKELINVKDGLAGEDYDGPLAIKPDQEPSVGKKDKALPYRSSSEVGHVQTADPNPKQGLAMQGSPGIKPETSSLGKPVDNVVKGIPKPRRLTSEEFVDQTKDMSDAEFVKYVMESHADMSLTTVTDLFGNEFTPEPTQAIEYVTGLIMGNPICMMKFIREVKRRGGMESMMAEVLQHNDSYDTLLDHFESDEGNHCQKFANKINDRYMSAFDNFNFGEEDDFEESVGPSLNAMYGDKSNKKPGGSFGAGGISPSPGKLPGGPIGGSNDYANNLPPSGFSGPDKGRSAPSGGMPMGGMQTPQFAFQPPKKMKEDSLPDFKGKNTGLMMINELSKFPAFKKHMLSRCTEPDC